MTSDRVRLTGRALLFTALASWVAVSSVAGGGATAQQVRPNGWTDATHGNDVSPDYARLFSMEAVHELRITISADRFAAMQADLETFIPGARPSPAGARLPEPIYIPVTVEHAAGAWTGVGMRYKGNSSLAASAARDLGKIPFRLDFDRYEDDVPGTRNQRFYGFDELTFSSNFNDDSQVREALAAEVLRDRGVPAPRTAFYRIYVDVGAGHEYWGLYTMVEDPADGAMLQAQFGSRSGNLYKPEGPAASWQQFARDAFEKKNNDDPGDFSDVEAAVNALHGADTGTPSWRTELERRFDVDLFLRWLAVNTVIENWDAYGAMPHNYYLYGDPARAGQLRWIPWDHNMAFGSTPAFGGQGMRVLGGAGRDILHRQVGFEWPLIFRLMRDQVYAARYRELLEHAMGGLMQPAAFERRARELHALIAGAVVGDRGERPTHTTISSPAAFSVSLDGPDGLPARVSARQALIRDQLSRPTTTGGRRQESPTPSR